jgi:hypothetical protein
MNNRITFTHGYRDVIFLIVSLEVFLLLLARWLHPTPVEWLKATTQYSGRLSLLIFSCLFLAGPGGESMATRYLIKPYHAFAWAHGIHLSEVLSYLLLADITLNPVRLSVGVLAYVMILVLPFLYDRYKSARLSPTIFLPAERVYHYYVWTIFFLTYLMRVRGMVPTVADSYPEHIMGLGYVSFLLGSRFITMLMKRRLRS